MNSKEIVNYFLEDYFGHDLFETLEQDDIKEAVISLNKLTDVVNNYFQLDEITSAKGILGERGVTQRTAESRDLADDLHAALVRRGMEGITKKELHQLVLQKGLKGSGGKNEDEDIN
tara:strand:- start:1412 stop:1762 length:351 start_codon:yes stop_codon:yes gene_type:complete